MGFYYQFKVDLTTPNTENNGMPAGPTHGVSNQQPSSLRGHKEVDNTSMLTSDLDSEPETVQRKPKKYRPSANGPSALRQQANKHSGASKSFQTKTPTHSYPIRGYKQPAKATNEAMDGPLPVETGINIPPKTSQVEMTDSPEQVETPEQLVNVETDSPIKGTLVTCSFELKQYKRP